MKFHLNLMIHKDVFVKIKRAKMFERTLEPTRQDKTGGSIDFGVKDIISGNVLREIEKKRGQTYTKSELVEYEIQLNGGQGTKYMLVWKDKWQTGQ